MKENILYTAKSYTCRIIEEDSSSITVKIDLIEHGKLLEDITKKF